MFGLHVYLHTMCIACSVHRDQMRELNFLEKELQMVVSWDLIRGPLEEHPVPSTPRPPL